MRLFLLVVGGCSVVVVSFLATTFAMTYFSPLCPQGPAVDLKGPFQKFGTGAAAP
jgi:hypothetical protein